MIFNPFSFPQKMQLVIIGEVLGPTTITFLLLPEKVQLVITGAVEVPDESINIAPDKLLAVLPINEQFVKTGDPSNIYIPPTNVVVLAVKMQFTKVGDTPALCAPLP